MISAKDFHKQCQYNSETRDQLWCSIIADSHDQNCGCQWPFAHLLSCLFPPGHKDRKLTIDQILWRDYQELCHSSGDAATATGGAPGEKTTDIKEETTGDTLEDDADVEQLLAAAAATAEEEER